MHVDEAACCIFSSKRFMCCLMLSVGTQPAKFSGLRICFCRPTTESEDEDDDDDDDDEELDDDNFLGSGDEKADLFGSDDEDEDEDEEDEVLPRV